MSHTVNIYDKLKELNITLPPVAVPAAAYVPFVQTGNLVFLSGHIAKKDGKPWVGQLGEHDHRRRQACGARDRHRPDGHAARRRVAATSTRSSASSSS
jgi:hypothetical protein